MSHYTVAVAPIPRYQPHIALSDVRAALRDCLKEATGLRKVGKDNLAMGRESVQDTSIFYLLHSNAATALARSASTRRSLHLLCAMLRGRLYRWIEPTCRESNFPHYMRIYNDARYALDKDKAYRTLDTFGLPTPDDIFAWIHGAKPTWLTPVASKAVAAQ